MNIKTRGNKKASLVDYTQKTIYSINNKKREHALRKIPTVQSTRRIVVKIIVVIHIVPCSATCGQCKKVKPRIIPWAMRKPSDSLTNVEK